MNQAEINSLRTLFVQYGYNILYEDHKYIIFSLENGMYPAVEIVPVSIIPQEILNKLVEEYRGMGYAVHLCESNILNEIESYLFNGFFRVKLSNSRIKTQYREYAQKQLAIYKNQSLVYQYINIPFIVEKNFYTQSTSHDLITDIKINLKSENPTLIIVEAAAGFGKTSTAYEILNNYSDIEKDVRPFLMELSKDRSANIFRYLLISQIDREFDTAIKSDIVIREIKNGRIPLIIDGFDELLSRDLDNGAADANFKDVETMLSTIAELLTDKAKIVLTTRKTAIFSGDSFIEWWDANTTTSQKFDIIRYQLGSPSVFNWLPQNRINLLPEEIKSNLANPVLLAYLRYIDDVKFETVVANNSTIIDSYFKFLLNREIERQELPFSIEEQLYIYRRLAAAFASFNISSEDRDVVKGLFIDLAEDLIYSRESSLRDSESLSNTLTNHALLDRKGNGNKIGFINDFIFGTMLAQALLNDEDFPKSFKGVHYTFWEKAIIAYEIQSDTFQQKVWDKLKDYTQDTPYLRLIGELKLLKKVQSQYQDLSFDGLSLKNIDFYSDNFCFENCSFANYKFEDCIFDFDKFKNTTFINCQFVNCDSQKGHSDNCAFYHCFESPENGATTIIGDFVKTETSEVEKQTDIQQQILESYFKVDGKTPRMKMVSKLRESFPIANKQFNKEFEELVKNGYLIYSGDKSFISAEGIQYYNAKYRQNGTD